MLQSFDSIWFYRRSEDKSQSNRKRIVNSRKVGIFYLLFNYAIYRIFVLDYSQFRLV
jgi:hypothetical protein